MVENIDNETNEDYKMVEIEATLKLALNNAFKEDFTFNDKYGNSIINTNIAEYLHKNI